MFDTIHFTTPLKCPNCGAECASTQTKEFDSLMLEYRVGSVIKGCAVHSGIIKETAWCEACWKEERDSRWDIYLIIWHSVLAGVEDDLAKAEARLARVDRLDLIGWLDDAQRESEQWRHRYWKLFNEITKWRDHLARKDEPEPVGEGAEKRRAFACFLDLPDEILNAPDPLAALIAANEYPRR
jgi:hypothetical protein